MGVRPGSCGPGRYFPTRGPPLCDATQSQETQPGAGATLARRGPLFIQLETLDPKFWMTVRLDGRRGFSLHFKVSWLLTPISCLSISPCEIRGSLLEDPISGFILRSEPAGSGAPQRQTPSPRPTAKLQILPGASKTLGPKIQQYPGTNQCIQTQPSGSLFTAHACVTEEVSTYTQQIPPFLRNSCASFHLRDAPIDRHATECYTARLPDYTHSLLGICPPGLDPGRPCAPGSSARLLRPTPIASTRTEPLVGLAWPAARSRHTLVSVPTAVHPTTRLCRRAIWNQQLRENDGRERNSNPHNC